jgi:hypothetical protein
MKSIFMKMKMMSTIMEISMLLEKMISKKATETNTSMKMKGVITMRYRILIITIQLGIYLLAMSLRMMKIINKTTIAS